MKKEKIISKIYFNSNLKIADFGLSAFCEKTPYLFYRCGTPGYIAPEIANLDSECGTYSSKCDVFSVGIIFHLLLTG